MYITLNSLRTSKKHTVILTEFDVKFHSGHTVQVTQCTTPCTYNHWPRRQCPSFWVVLGLLNQSMFSWVTLPLLAVAASEFQSEEGLKIKSNSSLKSFPFNDLSFSPEYLGHLSLEKVRGLWGPFLLSPMGDFLLWVRGLEPGRNMH